MLPTLRRGVLVRASVAGPREARYRAAGRDCYLFNLDDLHVLDATEAGAISRFTVRAAGWGARCKRRAALGGGPGVARQAAVCASPFQAWSAQPSTRVPPPPRCSPPCPPGAAPPQNHSCSPSLYTKILSVDGRQRLVFFARRDIGAGQELTYNYRCLGWD